MKRRTCTLLAALLLIGGVAVGCSGALSTARQPPPETTPALGPASYSFIFADETSVGFVWWTQSATGALTGATAQLQALGAGSPNFLASATGWTGTRMGNTLTIVLPGAIVTATLEGADMIREETDPQTGGVILQRWVPGTQEDYNTLVRAFRAYTAIGQDIAGVNFDIETAGEFPSPSLSAQVQSYLVDLQNQQATLQSLDMPHIKGLRTPWAISDTTVAAAMAAAQQFLAAATPQVEA